MFDVNSQGAMLGCRPISQPNANDTPYIWNNGALNLNSLLASGSGVVLTTAIEITDSGTILSQCYGVGVTRICCRSVLL